MRASMGIVRVRFTKYFKKKWHVKGLGRNRQAKVASCMLLERGAAAAQVGKGGKVCNTGHDIGKLGKVS